MPDTPPQGPPTDASRPGALARVSLRRSRRGLAALAVVAGLLWLALTWLLPIAAERLLMRQLQAAGWQAQLHVTRLTLWRAELASVHLGIGPDSSWIAELAADYTPGGLLRGQVDRVVADNAVLNLRQTAAGWILPGGANTLSSAALPSDESSGSGSFPHAGPSRSGYSGTGSPPQTGQTNNPASGAFPVAEIQLRNVTLRLLSDSGETRVHGHATLHLPDRRLARFEATLNVADGTVRTRGSINLPGASGMALVEATHVRAEQLWAAATACGVLPNQVAAATTLAGSISGRHYLHWRAGQLQHSDGAWIVTGVSLQRGPDLGFVATTLSATIQNDSWTLAASGIDTTVGALPPLAGIALNASGKLQREPALGTSATVNIEAPQWRGVFQGARQEIGPGKLTANLSVTADGATADWRAALPCDLRYGEFQVVAASEITGNLQLNGQTLSADTSVCFRNGRIAAAGASSDFDTLTVQAHLTDLTLALLRTPHPAASIAGSLRLTNGAVTHDCGVRVADLELATPFALGLTAAGTNLAVGTAADPARLTCREATWRSGTNGAFAATAAGEISGNLQITGGTLSADATVSLRQGRVAATGASGGFDTITVQTRVAHLNLANLRAPQSAESATASPAASIAGNLCLTNGAATHECGVRSAGLELATPFALTPAVTGWNLTLGAEKEPGRLTCREAAWRGLALDGFGLNWTPTAKGMHLTGSAQLQKSALAFTCAGDVAWTPELSAQVELTMPQAHFTQADPLITGLAPLPAGIEFSADIGGRVTARLKGKEPPLLSGRVTVANGEFAQAAKGLALHGIASTVEIEDLLAARSAPGQELTLQTAELANLHLGPAKARFRVESPTSLFLEQADVGWANGNIRGYAFRFNPLRPEGELTLYADRIEIQGILGLLKNFRGDAVGLLYGRLPLRIRNGTVDLSEGFLFSPPGQAGQLRMTETGWLPGALTQSGVPDQAVQRVKAALGDFEFTIFRLDLETTSAKDALLRLRLVGAARQDKTAPPVDLNINVRGPLQGLLNLGLQFAR